MLSSKTSRKCGTSCAGSSGSTPPRQLQVEVLPIEDGAVIAEHYEPGYDIIFMDVEMPGLDGFGAAEKIRAVDADAVLVFVTNMAQYAIRGYEVDALDYVLKPVNYYQFCTKLSRAIQRVQRRRGGQVVLQLAGGGIQLLDTADIYYLETHSRMLYYHTAKGEFAVRASLQSAEKHLPSTTLSAATSAIWSTWSTSRALKATLPL